MRKVLPFLILLLAFNLTSCKKQFQEGLAQGEAVGYENGYDDGQGDGYEQGHADGYEEGWDNAKDYFASADYLDGFTDGKDEGLVIGYTNGYGDGHADGEVIGYDNGYDDGHDDGVDTGYDLGYDDGFLDGEDLGYDNGYDDGYVDGDVDGYNDGYGDGYDDGFDDGLDPAAIQLAYDTGYNDGYDDGYDDGYFDGDNAGYNIGYDDGFNDGEAIGFDDGYDLGFDDGYDLGFDDGYDIGFDDGYDVGYDDGIWGFSGKGAIASSLDLDGLPNNNVANINGHVKVASLVLAEIINFKKVKKLEKAYLDGLRASASVLEETSAGSKDLAKMATLKEQFRVNELSKQIKSSFALSADRAQAVAKLATSWRKFANSRAITTDDANAFSKELLGTNVKDIESAYKQTLKGNMSPLKNVVKNAADQNNINEFTATRLMVKLFL
jgi:flagellar biosynthesis/type III secretory pathway protein FliH